MTTAVIEPVPSVQRDTDLTCRVQMTLETPDGESLVDLSLDEMLPDAMSEKSLPGLAGRVDDFLENVALSKLRRRVIAWVEENVPHTGDFESEFARRCDHNDDMIDALEYLSPHVESDEEREWRDREVDVFMARSDNDRAR